SPMSRVPSWPLILVLVASFVFPTTGSAACPPSAHPATRIPFHFYRSSVSPLAYRDIEFLWSDTYLNAFNRPLVPAGGGTNDLDRLATSICVEYENPFGFPMSDIQLLHDYLVFPDPDRTIYTYDTNPANPGFQIVAVTGQPDRNHVDSYIHVP